MKLFQKRLFYSMPAYLTVLLIGYYLFNLLSVSWSLNTAEALYECQKIFLVPCLVLLFLNWILTNEEEHLLVKSLILIALAYCVYAIVELLQLPDFNFETLYNVHAFAEHKNLLASFLCLLMAFPLYGLMFFKSRWKIFSGFALLLTFLLIIFLQTRSVYFALVVCSLIFFLCSQTYLKINRRKVIISVCLFIAVIILLVFFYPALFQRFNVLSYTDSASGNERLKVWANTFSLIKENILFGVGAGNWQYNYSKFGIGNIENVSLREITFQRPHNDLLWIFSETGIIGFTFIVLIIAFIFKKSYPELRAGNIKVILFFSFLSGLLMESFFSFPKERITHIFMASVLLTLLIKNLGITEQITDKSKFRIIIVMFIVLMFSGILGFYRLTGEHNTALLLQEKQKNNPQGVLKYGNKSLSAFYKCDPTSTPIYSYIGWAYSSMNRTDSMLYVSKRAYELSPFDHEVLSNYGSALERTGRRNEAREILKECLRINPFYEPGLVNMVVLEYNSRNFKTALTYLKLIPDYQTKYKLYLDKIESKLISL